jgi:hypothetical protein
MPAMPLAAAAITKAAWAARPCRAAAAAEAGLKADCGAVSLCIEK